MLKRILGAVIIVLIITSQSSCVKNNPTPAWIEVTEWQLVENAFSSSSPGELTQSFKNASVYVDNDFIGIFELPFKIPILKEGWKNITLYPVILDNGFAATKKIYPFVEPYIIEVNLVKGVTTQISPTTRYKANTTFTILDFENAGFGLNDQPPPSANIIGSNDTEFIKPFNGGQFGKVDLTSTNNYWNSVTNINVSLPQPVSEVYLELDIYCTEDVITGVIAQNSGGIIENPNIRVNEQKPEDAKWRKVYIELTTIILGSQQGSSFEYSFQAKLDKSKEDAVICLDNIKIVRF